jgi:RHS repeat-associated protein
VAGGAGATPANLSYAYTLDNAGHRTSVTEQSGRKVNYAYDNIYRLTSETISSDPGGQNGAISYAYDAVGNRTQQSSTVPAITSGGFGYDPDDRFTAGDTYDANGNTITSGGIVNVYDFENHLVQQGSVKVVYDGDGNRAEKMAGGVTTVYVTASVNPTGYAQVVEENFSGSTTESIRYFVYGLDRISQRRQFSGGTQTSYYVYDGHGSTRALTDPAGNVTDTYDYDAFGNEIHTATTLATPTPNEFLFAGEQYDSDLHLYYNRARYLNVTTGRFWIMDTYEGNDEIPLSLHKYLYVEADPIDNLDRNGNEVDALVAGAMSETLNAISTVTGTTFTTVTHFPFHAVQVSSRAPLIYNDRRADLPGLCNACYGGGRQYLYRLTDPRGVPFTDRALVQENNQILQTSDPTVLFKTGQGWTTNSYFMDTVGYATTDRPFSYVYTKTEQTFMVSLGGKTYPLSTKVNQYTEKVNGNWNIEAVVIVP